MKKASPCKVTLETPNLQIAVIAILVCVCICGNQKITEKRTPAMGVRFMMIQSSSVPETAEGLRRMLL